MNQNEIRDELVIKKINEIDKELHDDIESCNNLSFRDKMLSYSKKLDEIRELFSLSMNELFALYAKSKGLDENEEAKTRK